jgi:hypothetical protein
MTLKGYGMKWSRPTARYYPGMCLVGLKKAKEVLNKDSSFLG